MSNIVKKCIAWNAARYDRVYDYKLAASLLTEETLELFSATSAVEKLDAIGDIVFVAIGVFWKLGLSERDIEDILCVDNRYLANMDMREIYLGCDTIQSFVFDNIDETIDGSYPGAAMATYCLLLIALGALNGLGMQRYFYDVVDAICESNNTKELKGKVDPSIKANISKGTGFVPPTARLEALHFDYISRTLNQAKGN